MPKLWRESLGERGCRVMLFERTPGGPIYREVWVGGVRVAAQKSIGHRDREQAKAEAFTLLASLKARRESMATGHVTLATLFDKYDGSPAFRAKKARTQAEDRRKLEQVMSFLGRDRAVATIGPSDVQRYAQARMSGQCSPKGKPVRARAVAADLVALSIMLNWATRERRSDGTPLLTHNPLRGIRLPAEKNPRRPTAVRMGAVQGGASEERLRPLGPVNEEHGTPRSEARTVLARRSGVPVSGRHPADAPGGSLVHE